MKHLAFYGLILVVIFTAAADAHFANSLFLQNSVASHTSLAAAIASTPSFSTGGLIPLPFGGDCYTNPIFECGDYAFEFCQENGTNHCWQLAISIPPGGGGHAINIMGRQSPAYSHDKTWTFAVFDPQLFSQNYTLPITTWSQVVSNSNNPTPVVPPAAHTAIANFYLKLLGSDVYYFTPLIVPGTTPLYQVYPATNPKGPYIGYWANGWYPLNLLMNVVYIMNQVDYKLSDRPQISLCSSVVNTPCASSVPEGLADSFELNNSNDTIEPYSLPDGTPPFAADPLDEYPATVCIKDGGAPQTVACINGVYQSVDSSVTSALPHPSEPLTTSISSKIIFINPGSADSPLETLNVTAASGPLSPQVWTSGYNAITKDTLEATFSITGPGLAATTLKDSTGNTAVDGSVLPLKLENVDFSQIPLQAGVPYTVSANLDVIDTSNALVASYQSSPTPLVVISLPTVNVDNPSGTGATVNPTDTIGLTLQSQSTINVPEGDTFRTHFYISGPGLASTGLTGTGGAAVNGLELPLTLQGINLSQVSLQPSTNYSVIAKITILNSSGVPDPSLTTNSFQTPSTSLTINPTPPDCQVSKVYYSPSNALTASGDNNYKYSFYYRYTWSSGAYVPEYNGEEEVNYNNVYNAVTGQLIGQVANTTGVCSNDPNPSVENYPYSTNNLNPYASLPACPFPYAQAAAEPNFSTFTCPSTPTTPASPPPSTQPQACYYAGSLDGITDDYEICVFTPTTKNYGSCTGNIGSDDSLPSCEVLQSQADSE